MSAALRLIAAVGAMAWATSAQAAAVQCTQTSQDGYPGPKELQSMGRFGSSTAKAMVEIRTKPITMELVYEFQPWNDTAIATILDKDLSGAGTLKLAISSLVYTLFSPPNPSRPHDTFYIAIDRQSGVLTGAQTRHLDEFDETVISTLSGQCHAVTVPEPKL